MRDEKGDTRANSVYCRGISMLREGTARGGKLPEPSLVRLVTIVVEADEADELFEFIYEQTDIDRSWGGSLVMTPLAFATHFVLPEGVADEAGGEV